LVSLGTLACVRVAVVGHVEWIEFARVPHVPRAGEIVHASETWTGPGGGGGVAVVQLRKLAGDARLYTALGDDEIGRGARRGLEAEGVQVETTFRRFPQRRCFVYIDDDHERTITTIGERLGPDGDDRLDWAWLEDTDAVYFTAGDEAALRKARASRVLVATSRVMDELEHAGVRLDAVVGSGKDEAERYRPIEPRPSLVVLTDGSEGGTFETAYGERERFEPAPLPGPPVDAYGAGDSFAAGLTFALGVGLVPREAVALAARCGAAAMTGRGPFGGQLGADRV
jgi:ribokinase